MILYFQIALITPWGRAVILENSLTDFRFSFWGFRVRMRVIIESGKQRISYSIKIILILLLGEQSLQLASLAFNQFLQLFLNHIESHFKFIPNLLLMLPVEPEQCGNSIKKGTTLRRKPTEPIEFQTQITLQLDEFFRYFNYYYPGKNKEEIINKSITGNTYWITIDSLYYAQNVQLQSSKIEQFRKKSTLKNGTFPPTKDSLEQQKFILMVRKVVADRENLHSIEQIRSTPIAHVVQHLQALLAQQEAATNASLGSLEGFLEMDNLNCALQLEQLEIPAVRSARLFAYEMLEKEVIDKLVEKALLKEMQPRCDFCFTRDKEIVKCLTCDLHAHPLCFPKAQKMGHDFQCDHCSKPIPQNAHCELCPLLGGTFLELADQFHATSFTFSKGDSNLRFRITRLLLAQVQRRFIHISCFVLHPECNYHLGKGAVEGLHRIDRSKKNPSSCSICGNMIGMTVPCNNESCRRAFHPECAKRNNLSINVIKANNKALLEIYCQRHKKAESYEYLKDSVSNRVKELRKFYETLDYEIKRYGVNHQTSRQKKPTRTEDYLKADRCLQCGEENDYERPLVNCRKCYGWYHAACENTCVYCDS